MRKQVTLFILFLLALSSSLYATTYYSIGSVALNTATNWKTARDGTGTSPANFTTAGDVFVIQGTGGGSGAPHAMTLGTTMTIGSSTNNTKLQIENGASLTATSALTFGSAAYFQIDAGGTYNHNNTSAYASTILAGKETFDVASNFVIQNSATTGPGTPTDGTTTGFGNLTINNTTNSSSVNSSGALTSIRGNFTVIATGSSGTVEFRLTGSTALTLTIGGNLNIQGGILTTTNSSAATVVNLGGNLSISGGTLQHTATTNPTTNTINFTKSGTATFTKTGGSITALTSSGRTMAFNVNSGCTLDMGSNVLDNTSGSTVTFTLASGAKLITAHAGGIASTGTASGCIQTTTGTRTYSTGASYEYNGSGAQNTGSGLPTGLTGTLTINNSGNTVTLDNALSVGNGGSIVLTNGTFATGTNLTMSSTSSITRSGGSMTGTPQGSGTYNVTYTGNAKTSGTELSGSGINNITLNMTSGQDITLGASVTPAGTFTFTSGKLLLGSYDITANGTISGASSSNYFVTNGSGQIKRTVGGSAVTFPVGPSTSAYNPLILTNSGTSDIYGVIVASGSPANMPDATKTVNDTWTVTEAVSGGSTLAATTQWVSTDEASAFGAVRNTAKVGRWTGSAWESNTATVSGSDPYTAAASGFTGVGSFTTGIYDTGFPTVSATTTASSITTTTAQSGGHISDIGGSNVTASGVCYGTSASPTVSGSHTTDNTTFSAAGDLAAASLTSLTENTKYYYRAYATNSSGTAYGPEYNFTTLSKPPTSPTGGSITYNGFTASWTAPVSQGSETYTFTVEVDDDPAFGSLFNSYTGISSATTTQPISGLSPSTDYYFRVKAVNTTGASDWATSSAVHTSAPTPTITVGTVSAFGNQVANTTSSEASYSLTGAYLTADITVTPPVGFEVSKTSGSGFVGNPSTLTYTQSGGSVNSTVYVRFKPTAVQSYSDNITHESSGATTKNVAVSGSGIAPSAVTSLSVSHQSDNIIRLSWTAPASSYDNVVIFARPVSDVNYTPSGAGSGYNNANANIASAGVYNTDNYLVYSGTGTSIEVTGLSNSTAYYFKAYSYSGDVYSASANVNTTTSVQEVTSLTGTAGSGQVSLTWTNPTYNSTQTNYWDEVLVVARLTSANDGTPSGDGSAYTANTTFGQGTALGSGYVVYKGISTGATVTNLADGSTYYFKAFVRHGTVWSSGSEINKTVYPYANNDLGTSADNTWATGSNWKKWNSSTNTWDTYGSVPTSADNVWILNNVTLSASGVNCKDLHVANGVTLKNNTTTTTVRYINIYGTVMDVQGTGSIGTNSAGDAADGLAFNMYNDTLKITGSSTSNIAINRLQFYVTSSILEIAAHNVTINYHGSTNLGNASGLCVNSASQDNIVVQIDAGDTLTFAAWSCILGASSSSTSISNYNSITYKIYGTLQMTPGTPEGNSNTPTWGAGYISAAANTGKTFTMHVYDGGTLNATKFFSNGCPELTTSYPAPGTTSLIVDAGGVINFTTDTTDFTNTATITGNGTVNVNGSPFFIGSASGITSSSAAGPIQASTRNYASSLYEYVGSAASAYTGDGLPSSVTNLKIRNSSGVTLSNPLTVNGTLTLTSGDLTTGANTITLGSSGTLSETAGNTVIGNIGTTRTLSQSTNNTFGGLGVEVNAADAAPGSTTVTRVTGTALTGNSNTSIKRYFNIAPTNNSTLNATLVFHYDDSELNSLTESTLQLFKSTDDGSTWTLGAGTVNTTANTITLNGISDFSTWTAGGSDVPLPVELNSLTAVVSGRNVIVNWTTATEVNSYKFIVERGVTGSGVWNSVGEVLASKYSNSPKSYSYTDKNLNTGKYSYRLKMIDNDGTSEYSSIMANAEVTLPVEFQVAQNYPNPFNPGTQISFDLPNDAQVVIELYAVTGTKIAMVTNSRMNAGYNSIYLNMGKYNLPSGAYFYKVTALESTGKTYSQTRKMVYMK